jgi:4-amino-4-deoxy-L-arabinose transferase-like glycosyltransferase
MRTLGVLAVLLLVSICVQAWCIRQAAVPAQDAVRFIAIAQSIDQHGFVATWREHAEHPLYPALIYVLHAAWQRVVPASCSWGAAAQATSALSLILAVVPVYFLLRRLVASAAAAIAALFFCLLPEIARLGADALSDSTHLLLVCVALWALACHWQAKAGLASQTEPAKGLPHRARWLLICGMALGLAVLTRPEACVAAATAAVALVGFQCNRSTRQPWFAWCRSMTCLVAGLSIVAPYLILATSGRLAEMPGRLLGRDTPSANALTLADASGPAVATSWRFGDGAAMAFGAKDSSVSSRFRGYPSALAEYSGELISAFQYWIGALALIGLLGLWRQPWQEFDRFSAALFILHSLAAVFLAAQLGYLSTRHLLTLVILGLAPAGWGACIVGRWLADRQWMRNAWFVPADNRAIYATGLVALLSGIACLPETLSALHASRAGHRQAGVWLAKAQPAGLVLDTRGWTSLYSGKETLRYDMAKVAYRRPDLTYVVVEQRELAMDSPRGRTLRYLLAGAAEPVASFAAPRGKLADTVLVYRWHAERFTERLRTGLTRI